MKNLRSQLILSLLAPCITFCMEHTSLAGSFDDLYEILPAPQQPDSLEQSYVLVSPNGSDTTELPYPESYIYSSVKARAQYTQHVDAIADQQAPLTHTQITTLINFCQQDAYRDWQLATFMNKRLQRNDMAAVKKLLRGATSLNNVLDQACREGYNQLISLCIQYGATNITANVALLLCRDGAEATDAVIRLTTNPHWSVWSPTKALQQVLLWAQYQQNSAKTTFATYYFGYQPCTAGDLSHIDYAIEYLQRMLQ